MRMNEFTGTGLVFRFTLTQYLKSRSTIITMLVMVLVTIGSVFIAGYSMNSGKQAAAGIEGIAIVNKTGIPFAASDIAAADNHYEDISETAHDAADVVLTIYEEDGAFHILAQSDTVEQNELIRLEASAASAFDMVKSGKKLYVGQAMTVGEYLEPAAEDDFAAVFTVSYVYSILVLILTMLSSSYIIRSVLEEKASRLVEMLLVSVKPLALILGKILASMCLVILQLALLVIGGFAAGKLIGVFAGGSGIMAVVNGTGIIESIAGMDALSVISVFVSVMLGFFTLALIGGLSASCCDSMDDSNSAGTATVFTALAGYMVGIFAGAFSGGAASVVFSLIPVVSVFVAPVKYLEGAIDAWVLFAAWALQLCVIAVLAYITRRAYAALIMHTGSRVKFRSILRFAGIGGGK